MALDNYHHPTGTNTLATSHTTPTTTTTHCASWTESAYEWHQRSQRKRRQSAIPHDPASAAWAFCRATGISFLDAALRNCCTTHRESLPILHIRGTVGKTWTLRSVAARFLVATRSSRFPNKTAALVSELPHVIVLDSNWDCHSLTDVVRATLLREHGDDEDDRDDCLRRLHVATGDWSPLLESLRHTLPSQVPTLLLWDGFPDDSEDENTLMELVRQLVRLQEDCSVLILTTASSSSPSHRKHSLWDRYVTQHVTLTRTNIASNNSNEGHEYVAIVNQMRLPFSIASPSGILS